MRGDESRKHGKLFVLANRPHARLDFNDGRYEVVDWGMEDPEVLGDGRDPMDAWCAAAVEIQMEAS